MSSPSYIDSKAVVVELLGEEKDDRQGLKYSLGILDKKKAVRAIFDLERVIYYLSLFAINPKAEPYDPPQVQPPDISNMSPEEQQATEYNFRLISDLWRIIHMAGQRKVSPQDWMSIIDFARPYRYAIDAMSAVKGRRWHSLTKVTDQAPRPQGGLMSIFKGKGDQE